VRVILADDSVLFREGVARVLTEARQRMTRLA